MSVWVCEGTGETFGPSSRIRQVSTGSVSNGNGVSTSFTPRYYGTSVGETRVEELEDRWKELIRRRTNLRRRRTRISNRLRTLIVCSSPSRRYLQPDVRGLEFVRSEMNLVLEIMRSMLVSQESEQLLNELDEWGAKFDKESVGERLLLRRFWIRLLSLFLAKWHQANNQQSQNRLPLCHHLHHRTCGLCHRSQHHTHGRHHHRSHGV